MALERYEAGDYIGAGVRLRESVAQFVAAACRWYGVALPKKCNRPKTADYIRALRRAKHIDRWAAKSLLQMVDVGNKAAHVQSVSRHCIGGGISILFTLMDSEPYCGHERKPVVSSHKSCEPASDDDDGDGYSDGYDDGFDDRDGADWWKGGGSDG